MYTITFVGDLGSYTTKPLKGLRTVLKTVAGLRAAGIPCTYNLVKEGK